ncbi:RNA helicase [Spirochaetia bacterium]|nr:RNA helicase [Spirochaetia bacterium]GHU34611.1 RNA helicase [Spirochaetia bacterium]
MLLQSIKVNDRIRGIVPNEVIQIISINSLSSDADNVVACEIIYRKSDGSLGQQILYADNLDGISLETADLPWTFDADATLMRLASEAYRIRLAHLFDPHLAVYTSMIQPLPHQITAVYEDMLPRQPLRFLLADDPGAGKTIMTGLLIKELKVRGDLNRCLIVCPGNLVTQWQDELQDKFQLEFEILRNEHFESGNPFLDIPYCIARLDKLSRNDEAQRNLKMSEWDLIVCDEAHKMSASLFGDKEKHTKRYNLGLTLSTISRHFLLLTATPHNGKDDNFQLFLRLLDKDRFDGKNRSGDKPDAGDMMRRLVKEELKTFDGKPLFPERIAYTLKYDLSPLEKELYDAVTDYVRTGFARAEKVLNPKRAHAVGFALTVLQRRLASSPEAIYQSLRRRRERLEKYLVLLYAARDKGALSDPEYTGSFSDDDWNDFDDAPEEEINKIEEQFTDGATAAQTISELEIEIHTLNELEIKAEYLRNSSVDKKWEQVSRTLQDESQMFDKNRGREKIIIFTEHRETLYYLADKIRIMLGKKNAVVTIQGGMAHDERKSIEEHFKNDPSVSVLVATDAAGEGINLQKAHLMINYDLPWNPNRIEQRFGRIHRIGQRDVCHLWNLVANGTREGEVFTRLFDKLENERAALGGRVFDVLGKISFDEKPLRDLLIEAIRYGNDPKVRKKLDMKIDNAFDSGVLEKLFEERSLAGQSLGLEKVSHIREEMERLEARRMQPYFIENFCIDALESLTVHCQKKTSHRYTVSHIPRAVRETRSPEGTAYPIARSYSAITFEKEYIHVDGLEDAALICPGHPLLSVLLDTVLEKGQELLKQGTIFIDEHENARDRLLFYVEDILEDSRKDSAGRPIKASHRLHFIEIYKNGSVQSAGYAPYLDYAAPTAEELPLVKELLKKNAWWGADAESLARNYAVQHLSHEHLKEVQERRTAFVMKAEQEVKKRLDAEIAYWDMKVGEMYDQIAQGKTNAQLNADNFSKWAGDYRRRKKHRLEELELEKKIFPQIPTILGGAWVIPRAMVQDAQSAETDSVSSPEDRAALESIAMNTVSAIERSMGNIPHDLHSKNLGYDIESKTPEGTLRFIEVKAQESGSTFVMVTKNEMLVASNSKNSILAVVEINGTNYHTVYFQDWMKESPRLSVVNISLDLKKLRTEARVVYEGDSQF